MGKMACSEVAGEEQTLQEAAKGAFQTLDDLALEWKKPPNENPHETRGFLTSPEVEE